MRLTDDQLGTFSQFNPWPWETISRRKSWKYVFNFLNYYLLKGTWKSNLDQEKKVSKTGVSFLT